MDRLLLSLVCMAQALFDSIDSDAPLGCGAISCVYKAHYKGNPVAVKVRRAGIEAYMERDLRLLEAMARLVWWLPGVRWLSVDEAACEFSSLMRSQLDFGEEGRKMVRFGLLFAGERGVSFPTLIDVKERDQGDGQGDVAEGGSTALSLSPSSSSGVLVMSYESGESMSKWLHRLRETADASRGRGGDGVAGEGGGRDLDLDFDLESSAIMAAQGKELARLGVRLFFQMVLVHNFAHADLHPGNILIRGGAATAMKTKGSTGSSSHETSDAHPGLGLVLIDCGLTTSLGEEERRNFLELFAAVAQQRGRDAARLMMDRAPYAAGEGPVDPEGFVVGMAGLIDSVATSSFKLREVREESGRRGTACLPACLPAWEGTNTCLPTCLTIPSLSLSVARLRLG